MTFLHFVNCALLSLGPLFTIYKASKLYATLSCSDDCGIFTPFI